MEFSSGGEAAAKALIQHGVDTIFTLSGGHLNPIYLHLEGTDVRFFDTRHEQAAVWMAEAYGRLTRRPGVAMVTAGPGFTNALTPIASASMAGTPLVLISGCVGINFMEFERSITHGLPIVVVVANDLGWGMIRHSQEIKLGHAIDRVTELGRIDYHRFVESMGGVGFLVEKPDEIVPALDEAFASGRTACINAMTDPTAVSPGSIALANVGAYK